MATGTCSLLCAALPLGLCTHSSPSWAHPPPFLTPLLHRPPESWALHPRGQQLPEVSQGPAGERPTKEPGTLTSASENLSAWVRRSCLNLGGGSSGEGDEGPQGPGGHPQGPHPWACSQHGVPRQPADTYSSLSTTPLPLGSNIRKALRMASSGSVPGRPRKEVSTHTPSSKAPPGGAQGAGGSLHVPEEAGRCSPIHSVPQGSSYDCCPEVGLTRRLGFGTWEGRLKARFPTPSWDLR